VARCEVDGGRRPRPHRVHLVAGIGLLHARAGVRAQKAGIDKLAADMAVDFEGTGVATVSIWMGILLTEKFRSAFDGQPEALAETAKHAETPEFTGRLIDALWRDPALSELSGQTVIGAELAMRYDIVDEDGRQPPSHRDMLGAPGRPHRLSCADTLGS